MEINNRTNRLAKNTFILYIRSFVVMLIALYTSRVFLKALGVEDYGLYNVVGGVVTLFAFLRTSLSKSTQRFLNVAMASFDNRTRDVFKVSMTIHLGIAIIVILLAETLGLWFLNTHINIPEGRLFAANVIYQTSVISLLETIIVVPYTASIIAHEDMKFFALVSILDAILKLVIAFLLPYASWDRLIVYGILLTSVNIVNLFLFVGYCRKKFAEARFGMLFDKALLKEMTGYTSWTVVGYTSIVITTQGSNILMNMFHSVIANAAMGVANQVNHAFTTFTSSFQTAFNPQITKSFAVKDHDYLRFLTYTTSKFSYFLLLALSMPIMFNIEVVLDFWLDEVPMYSSIFCILILVDNMLNVLSTPFNYVVLSSNKIRNFQIVTSVIYLLNLVILYPLYLMGLPAVTALWTKIVLMIFVLFMRIYYTHKEVVSITYRSFISEVLLPILIVTSISVCLAMIVVRFFDRSLLDVLCSSLFIFLLCIATIYLLGFSKREKQHCTSMIIKKIRH